MSNGVDSAMADERPQKATVRGLWAELVEEAKADAPDDVPLYLTLPGAEARDLDVLVDRGVIVVTETGALSSEYLGRIVALESREDAFLQLLRKYPGLDARRTTVSNLLHSEEPTVYPTGSALRVCRARVVNLDLNQPVVVRASQGQATFPLIQLISKLALIHARDPHVDWTLCLTLHGELQSSANMGRSVQQFLAQNFARSEDYATASRALLGHALFDEITARRADFSTLATETVQRVLGAIVPKRITQETHGQGWLTSTRTSLRYGGSHGQAPMVTWIIDFRWDERASTEPEQVYHDSLATVLAASGEISRTGDIVLDNAA